MKKKTPSVGILAFHGDVSEHAEALRKAAAKLRVSLSVRLVRTKDNLKGLDGLILPGGESTTLEKLLKRAGMLPHMGKIRGIFGTCAGAILMSKKALKSAKGQETLKLIDITTDRNAYGAQRDSFEEDIRTNLGAMRAVFIRAPRIARVGKGVTVIARRGKDIVAAEEKRGRHYRLVAAFHPELTSDVFHRHFLSNLF